MTAEELRQFKISEPVPGYWRVVFSNPPMNLLNSTTVLELVEVVRRIEEAQDLRVVVFTSENREFFMARYDLSDQNPVAFAPTPSGLTLFVDATLQLNRSAPISIASIRGRARGGGSEFALACDIRFASREHTWLGQPEVGAGILPAGGGLERLSGLVGIPRALEIIACSDDYDAPTAERYGWINRAVPDADLDAFVETFARRIASFDTEALASAKALITRGASIDPEFFRQTLDATRPLIVSASARRRQAILAKYAASVGADFELRMGHHLGQAGAGT